MGRARDRRRERHDGEPEPRKARAAPADDVLELQRSAGNAAVSGLLARSAETALPADAKRGETAAGSVTLERIGTIAIESASLAVDVQRRDQEGPRDIVLTSRAGRHSVALSKALADGRAMAGVVVLKGQRMKLTGAIVTSYSTSSQGGEEIESWTLNVARVEFETEARDEGERPAP